MLVACLLGPTAAAEQVSSTVRQDRRDQFVHVCVALPYEAHVLLRPHCSSRGHAGGVPVGSYRSNI
jgi:hypothetical protein